MCEATGSCNTVKVSPGWWQVHLAYFYDDFKDIGQTSDRIEVVKCLPEAACLGGVYPNPKGSNVELMCTVPEFRRGQQDGYHSAYKLVNVNCSQGCRTGHKGIMCNECIGGWAKGIDGLCEECDLRENGRVAETQRVLIYLAILVTIFAILVLIGSLLFSHKVKAIFQQSMQNPAVARSVEDVSMKCKILLGFMQVLSMANSVFPSIPWPQDFLILMRMMNFVGNLDLFSIGTIGCIAKPNAVDKLLGNVLVVFCLFGAAALTSFWPKTCSLQYLRRAAKNTKESTRQEILRGHLSEYESLSAEGQEEETLKEQRPNVLLLKLALVAMFLTYPSTSRTILSMFVCTELEVRNTNTNAFGLITCFIKQNGDSFLSCDLSIQVPMTHAHTAFLTVFVSCQCYPSSPVPTLIFGSVFSFNAYLGLAGANTSIYIGLYILLPFIPISLVLAGSSSRGFVCSWSSSFFLLPTVVAPTSQRRRFEAFRVPACAARS
jgi:hypothetical protein